MAKTFVAHKAIFGTLNTVPHHIIFMAKCDCGAMREVDRAALDAKVKGMVFLDDISKQLRCRDCGQKTAKLVPGYYAAEGGE